MDLKKMKDIVDEVLSYSQQVPKPLNTEELIQKWYESKKRFIDGMKGELIYESPYPITFDIPETNKKTMVGDLADRFDNHYKNPALADFLFEVREDFFENILTRDYIVDDDKVICKGAKIIKAFKYFEKDKEKLVAMQNEASLLIQSAKVTGRMCLSVHPLDYLSSSENQYNWRSCHSLDGEYRAGNLSYMMDEVTVICYLKGEDNVRLPNFPATVPWNNKKWRMLMFISKDTELVFAGRQYPFHTDFAMGLCRNILSRMKINTEGYSQWADGRVTRVNDKLYTYYRYLYINGSLYKEKDIIQDAKHSRHFNDLLESSYYNPVYMWRDQYCEMEYEPMVIGAPTYCIKCGKYHTVNSETMLCEDCYDDYGEHQDEDQCECAECGDEDWIDDMVYVQDREEYVCCNCAASVARFCDKCNQFFSADKVQYVEEDDYYVCDRCRESDIPSDISDRDFF